MFKIIIAVLAITVVMLIALAGVDAMTPDIVEPNDSNSYVMEGETNIQALFNHELLQTLNVGRTSIVVDVQTVGLCIDDIGISSQSIEHRFSDVP